MSPHLLHPGPSSPSSPRERATYPSPQDLVDGRAFFQRALGDHLCSHFLHIQHERVKRFLYVGLLLFFFLFGVLMLSGCRQNRQTQPNKRSIVRANFLRSKEPILLGFSTPKPSSLREKHASTFGLLHPGKWNKNSQGRD